MASQHAEAEQAPTTPIATAAFADWGIGLRMDDPALLERRCRFAISTSCLPAHRDRGRPRPSGRTDCPQSDQQHREHTSMIDHTRHHRFRFRRLEGLLRQGDGAARRVAADDGAAGIHRRRQGRRLWARPADLLDAARASGRRTTSTSPSPRAAGPRSTPSTPRRSPPAAATMAGRDCGRMYHPNYYGAFVFDPDGNNVEAVCHDPA